MKWISATILAIAWFALAGCMDLTQDVTLNADGSGKAQILIKAHPALGGERINLNGTQIAQPAPDEVARKTAAALLAGAEGVDAWSNVRWQPDNQGLIEFSGTAYFPSIDKFSVGNMKADGMTTSGGIPQWRMQQDAAGVTTLQLFPFGVSETTPENAASSKKLSEAEIAAEIQQQRVQFQRMKPIMLGMLSGMSTRVTVQAPSPLRAMRIFAAPDSRQATMHVTGMQMLESTEKLIMDDKLIRALVARGDLGGDASQNEPPPEMMKLMFGEEGPAQVAFESDASQFDYEAEMTAARDRMPAEIVEMMARPTAKTTQ